MDGSLQAQRERVINRHRAWYVAEGVLFIVVALLAFFLPVMTVIALELILAALLLVSGLFQAYQGIRDHSGWLIASGLLSIVIGVVMLVMPMAGAIALATLVAFFLLFEGVVEILLSLQMRYSARWGWLFASGLLSLILGILLFIGWPGQTVGLVGIFLGVNFLLYGIALLVIVGSLRRSA